MEDVKTKLISNLEHDFPDHTFEFSEVLHDQESYKPCRSFLVDGKKVKMGWVLTNEDGKLIPLAGDDDLYSLFKNIVTEYFRSFNEN